MPRLIAVNEPLVSVIIPSYNHANFIERAVTSALNQTYKSIEVLVIDNHSTDSTDAKLNTILKQHKNLSIYKIQNNGVIAASRNLGAHHAKGKWLAFLDSDDYWHHDKIEHSIRYALYKNCDLVCHAEQWVYEDSGEVIERVYGPKKFFQHNKLLYEGNCISTSAVILKKSIFDEVGGFSTNREFIGVEDYDLWLKLSRANSSIEFINKVLGSYRIHKSNMSGHLRRQMDSEICVLKHHHQLLKNSFIRKVLYLKRVTFLYLKFYIKKSLI